MISRVADHLFWLGRYIERAESMARLLSVTETLSLDAGLPDQQVWPPVVIVSGEQERFEAHLGPLNEARGPAVLSYLTWETECPVSLARSIGAARDNARAVRETISLELWSTINELWLWLRSDRGQRSFHETRHDFYRRITRDLTLVWGELSTTMLRDAPYRFVCLGTYLERAGQTARVLDVFYHALRPMSPDAARDAAMLWALLRACSSLEGFMKRYHGRVGVGAVVGFLLGEPELPRSIQFSLGAALKQLRQLRPDPTLPGGRSQEQLDALLAWLEGEHAANPEQLHEILTRVVNETSGICITLGEELFGYEPPPSQEMTSSQ